VTYDLHGGNRIPKLGERRARSVAKLRASGLGVDRVMYLHDGSRTSSDSLLSVLTMLDGRGTRVERVGFAWQRGNVETR